MLSFCLISLLFFGIPHAAYYFYAIGIGTSFISLNFKKIYVSYDSVSFCTVIRYSPLISAMTDSVTEYMSQASALQKLLQNIPTAA